MNFTTFLLGVVTARKCRWDENKNGPIVAVQILKG